MKRHAIPLLFASALTITACTDTTADDTNVVADETALTTDATAEGSIVEVAQGNADFSTLVAAITSADLAGTLSGAGPYTVFAPNNAAFDKLPEGALDNLMMEENRADLAGILNYHVVSGDLSAEALTQQIEAGGGQAELTTANGEVLTASVVDGNVVLTDPAGNTARVVSTDIDASNGVIHVIDTVLMPEAS